MTKHLIINADDYGLTSQVSLGIREAHLNGVVTSASCMMNFPATHEDIILAETLTPGLGLGVHLNLTSGVPILPPHRIPTLCNNVGNFKDRETFIQQIKQISVDEVITEWKAQIEVFISITRGRPTHLDSHHHSSYYTPDLFRGMVEVAAKYDCAIRLPISNPGKPIVVIPEELLIPSTHQQIAAILSLYQPVSPTRFIDQFYDNNATENNIIGYINLLQDGTTEIMCHPGYNDDSLQMVSSYTAFREKELHVLKMDSIRDNIIYEHIHLISYREILHESDG